MSNNLSGSSGSLVGTDAPDPALNLSPWPPSCESDSPPRKIARTLTPNLTRRSHRKSRGGCFSCKARKIKCQETRPSCENCVVKDLGCRYPSNTGRKVTRRSSCASSLEAPVLRNGGARPGPSLSPPTSLNMDDMRFFHHFLTVAYPYLPLGNDSVWIREIPIIAQQHEYLMHAILALGASHLTRISPRNHSTIAIIHRGHAIRGLNKALAKGSRGHGEADALLAACYALAFQAFYMGDGMADFITMVRGCALVTEQIKSEKSTTAFNVEKDMHILLMNSRLDKLPRPDLSLVTPAITSVEALRPLLRTSMDQDFHSSLLSGFLALQESSKAGYFNFIRIYDTFFGMRHAQFSVFIDTANVPCQLLMAHFLALQMLIIPLTVHDGPQRVDVTQAKAWLGTVEWAERIFERTPARMTDYLKWPRTIMETVRREIEALSAGAYQSLRLRILDP